MSEVERYWIDPGRLVQEGWHQDDTCVVKDWAYDRVVAERDALQQRMNDTDERVDVLEGLLLRVVGSSVLSFEQDAPEELESLEADICAALKSAEGSGDD